MVRITEELIRKKSEHNEGIITTLEELSLHQEDVEKIEHINNWCKDIQILYLQANLIAKIENLNKLKKLQYLNLAINNIEKVENLQGCESLEKLDLTLNFIGDLESVCTLRRNIHLRHLYLTGNPCCDYKGYRPYVIAVLLQIETLDCKEIIRSERIKALQNFQETERQIKHQQTEHQQQRNEQRARFSESEELDDDAFWKTPSENSPESRVEIAKRARRHQEKQDVVKEQKVVKLFNKDGRPLNINQAKVDFHFNDEDPEKFVLDVAVYKYLDTSLVEVDVQPIFVKIVIKGKVFQFVLPEEVATDRSTAQRSQTTGHLVVTMPKVNFKVVRKAKKEAIEKSLEKTQFLEVEKREKIDFRNIVFEANSEIPPLEYC